MELIFLFIKNNFNAIHCYEKTDFIKEENEISQREANDKIHITCIGEAILLAATLKAKGYSARVRSRFVPYIKLNGQNFEHWIAEYLMRQKGNGY